MLHITVLAVGKLKERFWKDACAEYQKRLQAYAKVSVVEVADSNKEAEATRISAKLPNKGLTVLLDVKGKSVSSPDLAKLIEDAALQGESDITFIIGGSDGVTEEIKRQSDIAISFGAITLPHNLARVVLLEQIYRAFKIINHEPYHK